MKGITKLVSKDMLNQSFVNGTLVVKLIKTNYPTLLIGIFSYRVGFTTKQKVPSGDTTYMCLGFDLPDGDFHLVATESEIDNINVAHHMVIYGCNPMGKSIGKSYSFRFYVAFLCLFRSAESP